MIVPTAKPLLERWIFVLIKVDTEFLAPYTVTARERIEREGGYGDAFAAFLDRFLTALAAPDWPAGTYYPGGWFRALTAQGQDPARAELSPRALAKFFQGEFRVEADGRWRVGEKNLDDSVRRFFLGHLQFDPGLQRYLIRYWLESYYETRYVHHLSPPLRVAQVAFGDGKAALTLNDGTQEPLRPDTLRLDGEERLLCAVKAEGLPALFEDNARWLLLDHVEEREDGRWMLALPDGEVALSLQAQAEFPGGAFPPGP